MLVCIEAPTMNDILFDEFMRPMKLSAAQMASDIHVPVDVIQNILHGHQDINADISIRLGRYFGVSDRYFLHLQNDIDMRRLMHQEHDAYASIQPFQAH